MTALRKGRILTIPNLLSLLRLALIPLIVLLHSVSIYASAGLLILSGLTDLLDGWYARKFQAITPLGKALDPIADKLTQAAVLILLCRDHITLRPLVAVLVVKEIICGSTGAIVIHRTGVVPGAVWHGKAAALLLYMLMLLHIIWKDIPAVLSNTLTVICIAMMLMSLALYTAANIRRCRAGR